MSVCGCKPSWLAIDVQRNLDWNGKEKREAATATSLQNTNSNEVDPEALKIYLNITWNVPIKYHTKCGWDAVVVAAASCPHTNSHSENLHKLQSLPCIENTHTHTNIKHKSGKY